MVCIDDEIPFEIPQGWGWVRGRYGFIPMESTKPIGDTFIYIDVAAVNNKTNIIEGARELFSKDAPSRATRKLHKNDILFSLVRPYLRNIALVPEIYSNAIASTGYYIITPSCGFYPQYLFLLMLSPYVVDGLNQYMKGENSPSINNTDIENFLFPVPPLKEQVRIVDFYSSAVPLIDRYGTKYDELEKLNSNLYSVLSKSILQEAIQGKLVPRDPKDEPVSILLQRIREEKQRLIKEGKLKKKDVIDSTIFRGDDNKYYEQIGRETYEITEEIPFLIPTSWEWCRMGAIGVWGAGSTPAKGNPNYYGGNILWLRTGELNNSVVYDTEIKITQKALEECSLRMNKVGDVMIAMYGATIGKVAIAGKEMTTNQACCACTPIGIYNWYLFYYLMASQQDFVKIGEGGAQPNISREKLISHLIPVPPAAEQRRIVETLTTLLNRIKS